MPTRDAANSLMSGDMLGDFFKRKGISILEETGELRLEVIEILEIARQYNATIATGHISPKESIVLCREGRRRGVRMVLTHPEFPRTDIEPKIQRELAELGVFIEKCWYNIAEKECEITKMAQHIRTVGVEHCFLTTDRGQGNRETPIEGMKLFLEALLEQGFTEEELFIMTHTVPCRVLGLSDGE